MAGPHAENDRESDLGCGTGRMGAHGRQGKRKTLPRRIGVAVHSRVTSTVSDARPAHLEISPPPMPVIGPSTLPAGSV